MIITTTTTSIQFEAVILPTPKLPFHHMQCAAEGTSCRKNYWLVQGEAGRTLRQYSSYAPRTSFRGRLFIGDNEQMDA